MRVSRTLPSIASAPIAVTIGNFDGVHVGHQAMLARLADASRELKLPSCVMTFEPHPREFFAPDQAPTRLTSLREKLQLLAQFGVGRVQICRFNFDFAKTAPEDFIERILHRGLAARCRLYRRGVSQHTGSGDSGLRGKGAVVVIADDEVHDLAGFVRRPRRDCRRLVAVRKHSFRGDLPAVAAVSSN